jgi:hypothetical protein
LGLQGILSIDVFTFLIAIGTLAVVHVPQPIQSEEGRQAQGSMLKESAYGFRYIFSRPSLLGLQLIFFFGNLFAGISSTILAPMILARTGQNSLAFGTVQTAGAVGSILGGILMSVWGGFGRRVHGVLGGWVFSGIFGTAIMGLKASLPVWIAGMVFEGLAVPLINGSNQAIWQSKVEPDLQGRVFSARRLIAWFTNPVSPIIGGLMADRILEPAMMVPGPLSARFGWLVGSGPGAGMGLLMIICGLSMSLVGLAGFFIPAIRHAEDLLPDHQASPRIHPGPAGSPEALE